MVERKFIKMKPWSNKEDRLRGGECQLTADVRCVHASVSDPYQRGTRVVVRMCLDCGKVVSLDKDNRWDEST